MEICYKDDGRWVGQIEDNEAVQWLTISESYFNFLSWGNKRKRDIMRVLVESEITKIQIQKTAREEIFCLLRLSCFLNFCQCLPSAQPIRRHWEGGPGKCNSLELNYLWYRRKMEERTGRDLRFNRQIILLSFVIIHVVIFWNIVISILYANFQVLSLYTVFSEYWRLQWSATMSPWRH